MKKLILIFFCLLSYSNGFAAERIVNLFVGYKKVYFAGQPRLAIAVNNQIPAPTLHFKEGDDVTINVYNCLNKETAIHWHGILVPWQMDGVLGIAQEGIQPGHLFQYRFKLLQSGTYWYHAHAGLQEQQGLYGAFLIDPIKRPSYQYNKDFVIVLSDWSNTYPEQIMANLKKEGDYYSPRFPLQPSLAKFIHDYRKANAAERKSLLDDYKMMQQMRMSIYDLSDVAYDAFLLNGQPCRHPWTALVKQGDIVRLRFIGATGDTIYHVKIPGATMQMIHVEGNDISPYLLEDFTIAPGETYDVLVHISENKPTIIYAEARNRLGVAYGALITSPNQFVNFAEVKSFPEPLPVTREMMANMMMSGMSNGHGMNMRSGMSHMNMKMDAGMQMNQSKSNIKMESMSHSMKMDSGMKMDHATDNNMKMDSGMKMDHSTDKNMKMDSMSHSMNMNTGKTKASSQPMKMSHQMNMKMNHQMSMQNMNMNMNMPIESTIIGDKMTRAYNRKSAETFGTKYQDLVAAVQTNDPEKPINGVIKMELFGYMDRFIWFINGLPEYKVKPIRLEPGKRYRIIFINTSMMHHPMHIHGHWFILRNGHGAYDPLLHTLDVAPGATVTVDIDADASGQWFFHCHMLYHMVAGMSRVFQYSTLIEITKCEAKPQNIVKKTSYHNRPIVRVDEIRPIDIHLVKHPMAHPMEMYFATFLDVGADPFNNVQRLTYKGLYGYDYNKLELFTNDAEINKGTVDNADIDIFYWHLLSQFWAVKGGVNYFYRPAKSPYWQPGIGIEGLMPYFIDTNVRGYLRSGSAKLDIELARDTQITNNFFIRLGIRSILASKTVTASAIGSGLNQMRYIIRPYYRLRPGVNLNFEFEHEQDYGVFRNIQRKNGEATSENTYTFGVSLLF